MKRIILFMSKYYFKFKTRIILYYLTSIFLTVLSIVTPYLTGKYIDVVVNNNSFYDIKIYSLIFFFISILSFLFKFFQNRLYVRIQSLVSFSIIKELVKKIQSVSLKNSLKYEHSYLSQRINNDSNEITIGTISIFDSFLNNFIVIIATFMIVSKFNKTIFIVMLLAIILYILGYNFMKNKIYNINKTYLDAQSEFFSKSNMQIESIFFIKLHSVYEEFLKILERSFNNLFTINLNKQKVDYIYDVIDNAIFLIMQIFIFLYGGYLVINKQLTIGELSVLSIFFNKLLNSIGIFFDIGQYLQLLKANMVRIDEIMKFPDEVIGKIEFNHIEKINCESLSFSYDNINVISDINYSFEKGKIYYISGRNGSGKSTFLNLIVGLFINDYDGEIYYNDINIKKLNIKKFRKYNISMCEQNFDHLPYLFGDSTEINLNIANEIINDFKLAKYISISDNNFFLDKNKIKEFSIGESQKLFLVWAISKFSDLLILDEPTSAMDFESKQKFLEYIEKYKKNKITIIVSHDNLLREISDEVLNF